MKHIPSLLIMLSVITMAAYAQMSPRDRYLSPDYQKYTNDIPGDKMADAKKAFVLLDEGIRLYKQKKDNAAIEKYEEALELYAAPDIYYHYGNSLANTGELIYSARAYEFALERNCTMPALAWYNLACVFSQMKKTEKTYNALRNAVLYGYSSIENMRADSDLLYIRTDAQWKVKYAELGKLFARGETQLPSGKKITHGIASTVDIYSFCANGKVMVHHAISEIKNHKKFGTWKFSNYVLTISWYRETGEKGVGKPTYCAAKCEYKTYALYKIGITKKETIMWQEIHAANGGEWKVEPLTDDCE